MFVCYLKHVKIMNTFLEKKKCTSQQDYCDPQFGILLQSYSAYTEAAVLLLRSSSLLPSSTHPGTPTEELRRYYMVTAEILQRSNTIETCTG